MSTKPAGHRLLGRWREELYGNEAGEIAEWAQAEFDEGLFCLSSFGVDSAVTFKVLQDSGVKPRVVTVDTGFLFPETREFRDELAAKFDLDITIVSPDTKQVREINLKRTWETDIAEYQRITKVEPLNRAIGELGIKGLISGVRRDQTQNRSHMSVVENGSAGEVRIHPILEWSHDRVESFIESRGLPRHPLYEQGYASVGDWTTTQPGGTRNESRVALGDHAECGMHLIDGKLVRTKDSLVE